MNHDDLRDWSKRAADWAHAYHATLRDRPVRAPLVPGAVARHLPAAPPETAEPMETIFADFERIVPDGMTHWQHPRFFAYFPANAAPASMLAEQLANAMAAQGMLWQTSPAATEVEQVMVDWLRQALGLPDGFTGTLHDSATTATLSAVLTMRERALDWRGLAEGLSNLPRLRIYASAETHSSVDKAVRLSGIGQDNLVKIPTDTRNSMQPGALAEAITADRAAGYLPAGVVLCAGGTSIGAFDRIADCIEVARLHSLPVHVDAAWAGSAMICPEFRDLWAGVGGADSIVFNPHKWLGAQFDCAVQFLRDPGSQIRTLGLRPAYLATPGDEEIVNFNEWTVPLGRRFRALKLWFLIRAEGLEGLRARIRNHVAWAEDSARAIGALPGIEIVTEPSLSLFTFAMAAGDAATEALLNRINDDGRIYLTPTRTAGRLAIRVQVGQFDCTAEDVAMIPQVVGELLDK
ncbi:pyridoxal-dependent decarboxylase [Tabrizicola sp. J26]|uniref:pyridoxal phosphate-dependent decarboxylase family protein n=1 Tax=Alitabrizicola rongguiensis TaxID=2909234 RepID=UPI001F327EB4|nr:pyridoxal-dependent decarboxylase [Tabrizicola rongguiensis]MCF1710045.1 pyridoxal-dependent decarboxylase [Tabrizicola rongguiensis]